MSINKPEVNFTELFNDLDVGVVIHAADSAILYANAMALKLLQLTPEESINHFSSELSCRFIDAQKNPLKLSDYPVHKVLKSKQKLHSQIIGIETDLSSNPIWVLVNATPNFNAKNQIETVTVVFTDITQKKEAIPFEDIVSQASDSVIITQAQPLDAPHGPKIVYVNKSFTRLTGYTSAEVIGKTPRLFQGEKTSSQEKKRIHDALVRQAPITFKILNYSKWGREYWIESNLVPLKNTYGEVVFYASIQRDISARMDEISRLKEEANIDYLTKIYNRRGLDLALQELFSRADETALQLTFATFDIDYFKRINDTHGHDAGDRILRDLAKKMNAFFAQDCFLARTGGEEFLVVLFHRPFLEALKQVQEFVVQIKEQAFTASNQTTIKVTLSAGVCFLKPNESIKATIKKADMALYQAKTQGRDQVQVAEN